MPETDRFGIRYPDTNDLATVPAHMQELADDVDMQLLRAGARGKRLYISSQQTVSAESPVLLGSPDRIQEIELETAGLIWIYYRAGYAPWGGAGADQLVVSLSVNGTEVVREYLKGALTVGGGSIVTTGASGAFNETEAKAFHSSSDNAGFFGMPISIPQSAGTYTLELKFGRTGSGSMGIFNRTFCIWTQEFEDVSP